MNKNNKALVALLVLLSLQADLSLAAKSVRGMEPRRASSARGSSNSRPGTAARVMYTDGNSLPVLQRDLKKDDKKDSGRKDNDGVFDWFHDRKDPKDDRDGLFGGNSNDKGSDKDSDRTILGGNNNNNKKAPSGKKKSSKDQGRERGRGEGGAPDGQIDGLFDVPNFDDIIFPVDPSDEYDWESP